MSEQRSGSTRCFHLIVRFGQSPPKPCQAPVRWQGVIRTVEGTAFHVFSCEDHAGVVQDRRPMVPTPSGAMRADPP